MSLRVSGVGMFLRIRQRPHLTEQRLVHGKQTLDGHFGALQIRRHLLDERHTVPDETGDNCAGHRILAQQIVQSDTCVRLRLDVVAGPEMPLGDGWQSGGGSVGVAIVRAQRGQIVDRLVLIGP